MTTITTHVLDTAAGRPAAGLEVRLERLEAGGDRPVASGQTDGSGRVRTWSGEAEVGAGQYRLSFDTGAWSLAAGRPVFYPRVIIEFEVQEGESHYHMPLLLAPFSYTTYRGS